MTCFDGKWEILPSGVKVEFLTVIYAVREYRLPVYLVRIWVCYFTSLVWYSGMNLRGFQNTIMEKGSALRGNNFQSSLNYNGSF